MAHFKALKREESTTANVWLVARTARLYNMAITASITVTVVINRRNKIKPEVHSVRYAVGLHWELIQTTFDSYLALSCYSGQRVSDD